MIAGEGFAFRADKQLRLALGRNKDTGAFKDRPVVGEISDIGKFRLVAMDKQAVQFSFINFTLGFCLPVFELFGRYFVRFNIDFFILFLFDSFVNQLLPQSFRNFKLFLMKKVNDTPAIPAHFQKSSGNNQSSPVLKRPFRQ